MEPVASYVNMEPERDLGEEDESGVDPIAVKKRVPGVLFVAAAKAAGKNNTEEIERWVAGRVENFLVDIVAEARRGAVDASDGGVNQEAVDLESIVVTIHDRPATDQIEDKHEMAIGDRLLDAMFGVTTDDMLSPAVVQIDLHGETAEAVSAYVDQSEKYNSPVEFIGHRVFDEVLGASESE